MLIQKFFKNENVIATKQGFFSTNGKITKVKLKKDYQLCEFWEYEVSWLGLNNQIKTITFAETELVRIQNTLTANLG